MTFLHLHELQHVGQHGWCFGWVALAIHTGVRAFYARSQKAMVVIGVTLSRVLGGSGLCRSGEQDTVGSVVAVSDPRSMNSWAQIIVLIFRSSVTPNIRESWLTHFVWARAGLFLTTVGGRCPTWLENRCPGHCSMDLVVAQIQGWHRSRSGNQRGTDVTAASLRQ